MGELSAAGRAGDLELKNLCVWCKTSGGMDAFYRSQHELVFVFKAPGDPHLNTFELGQHGRYRTNVCQYAGVNTFRKGRMGSSQFTQRRSPSPWWRMRSRLRCERGSVGGIDSRTAICWNRESPL